jgi:hypothetical protein
MFSADFADRKRHLEATNMKSHSENFYLVIHYNHCVWATLTIVMCCVKIQNDCSEFFETRQGLRQGDVLTTLLFNVVMEVIVRRANLQTTGNLQQRNTTTGICR